MKQVLLAAACDVVMGQAPDGESYNRDGEGMPLVAGAGDFGDRHPVVSKFTTAPGKTCEAGDILLGIRATIGEKVIADRPYCVGRGVAALRPKAGLDSRYLWHWLTHVKPELQRRAKGATFKQVTRTDVGELRVSMPTLAEQRRIAYILDRADAMRAKRREAIALLDALPQALFSEMFGDPLSNCRALPMERLSRLGTLDRGVSKQRPRSAPELLGGPYPLVQTGDVANSGGYIRRWQATYSEVGLRQSRLWPAGTLCITIAANIARAGILTFEACFPDSVVGFRSDPATVEFVRVWLLFLQKSLEDAAPESAQKNINLDLLRNLRVPVPSLEERQEFARRVEAVGSLEAANRASLVEMDALFASLQHRAFRGEL